MGHFPWGAPRSHVMRAAFFLALLLLQDLGEGHPSSPVGNALDQPFLARRREIRVQRQRVSKSGGRQTRGKTHGDAKLHRRRIDQGQKERESSAAAAMPDQEPRVEEEGLLEEAIRERSINKYFAADPLWTGQLVASGLAWALVVRYSPEFIGSPTSADDLSVPSQFVNLLSLFLLYNLMRSCFFSQAVGCCQRISILLSVCSTI
jgi:hypothetical protein